MRSLLFAACALPLHLAVALEIYHRLITPSSSASSWQLRGTIDLTTLPASYSPSSDVALVLANSASAGKDAIYQIALASEGVGEDEWSYAGVRACFAASALSDTIILRSTASGEPYTLSYAIDPAPTSPRCPDISLPSSHLFRNTSIHVRLPDKIPPLALKTPPQLDESGETVKPEPEKSFIQKYWMYLLPVMLLLLVAPGGDEGQGGGGGGGGR